MILQSTGVNKLSGIGTDTKIFLQEKKYEPILPFIDNIRTLFKNIYLFVGAFETTDRKVCILASFSVCFAASVYHAMLKSPDGPLLRIIWYLYITSAVRVIFSYCRCDVYIFEIYMYIF